MKTFNYESNCVKYNNCFFDVGEYEKGKLSLAIYGNVGNNKDTSHISNVTVNVEEKLEENQVVIDTYANSNLISFLLDLGIVTGIPKKVTTKFLRLPVVDLDLDKLYEYSYDQEVLKYAS